MPATETVTRELTIRERVRLIQVEMRDGNLTPMKARENLVMLTGLVGNVADEQRKAEHDYKLVLLGCLETEKRANRARIIAETTPAYARAKTAKDTAELVKQMIVTCRSYLRSLDEEIRLSR